MAYKIKPIKVSSAKYVCIRDNVECCIMFSRPTRFSTYCTDI